jgi:hypothetical protein
MANDPSLNGIPKVYRGAPPLLQGEDPFSPDDDGYDSERVEWLRTIWRSQDELLRDRDRLIEANIRMLCGQQWNVWSRLLGRWVDVSQFLSDDERRWRFMPVLNRLIHWFMLLHARLTENPPVLSFQAGPDQIDAELAEVADSVWKHLWYEANMADKVDEMYAWLIPSGRSHMKSRIDPDKGDPVVFKGPAVLSVMGGGAQRVLPNVPYGPDGQPRAELLSPDGDFRTTGSPHIEYEGAIVVDVLSALECRGQWGSNIRWEDKSWHVQRSLLTPAEVYEAWGIEVDPTIRGEDAADAGVLKRLLRGAGYWGASQGKGLVETSGSGENEDLVEVFEYWQKPGRFPGTERTEEQAGGRLLITAGDKRVRDGQRYAPFRYTSPIRAFDFVNIPSRPSGTSVQEMMNGPQKTFNRVVSQILQHSTLTANPIRLVDAMRVQDGQITNRPGVTVMCNDLSAPGDPIRFVPVPSLGSDVWRTQVLLRDEMIELGNIAGAEGTPPTSDSSGELVKELRFNSDRFVGPTARRTVSELARMAEDWNVMIPLIWDEEKIIRVAGDDLISSTITVMPELFQQGNVNAKPDVESMLPEGRGERQARVERHYEMGLYGPPGTPEAVSRFFELSRFPHMAREARPGGMDRVTAEQNVGRLLQGVRAEEIDVFEWYEHGIHIFVLERVMKSPQYIKLPVHIQQEFYNLRALFQIAQSQRLIQNAELESAVASSMPAPPAESGGEEAAQNPEIGVA